MTEAHESENSYVFNAENASEIARLLERNAFFKEAMGGSFPERADLTGIMRILDVGCGPGGWAVDVASGYPHLEVVGIDISKTMIAYATSEAQRYTLQNATFTLMNALQPLNFPDQHFDLVNMRAAVEYIPRDKWHPLLQECYRITRPGGILRLMEADRIAHTNNNAFEKYHTLYSQMLHQRGYGFSPDGYTFGITPMLGKLLHNAGYQRTFMKSFAIDLSYNTIFHPRYLRLIEMRFEEVRQQLLARNLARNLATPEALANTYKILLDDVKHEAFCAVTFPLIFWGEK